jgi:cephalosporin hydroxylase
MQPLVIHLAENMRRAMRPFVLPIYSIVREMKPENCLSIGIRQCQAERAILCALKDNEKGLLVSLDIKDYSTRVSENSPELMPYWKFILGDSLKKETIDLVSDRIYDFICIDGLHTAEAVESDYRNFAPLVRKGGIIVIHDVVNKDCGVPSFWKYLKEHREEMGIDEMLTLPWLPAGLGIIVKK